MSDKSSFSEKLNGTIISLIIFFVLAIVIVAFIASDNCDCKKCNSCDAENEIIINGNRYVAEEEIPEDEIIIDGKKYILLTE